MALRPSGRGTRRRGPQGAAAGQRVPPGGHQRLVHTEPARRNEGRQHGGPVAAMQGQGLLRRKGPALAEPAAKRQKAAYQAAAATGRPFAERQEQRDHAAARYVAARSQGRATGAGGAPGEGRAAPL